MSVWKRVWEGDAVNEPGTRSSHGVSVVNGALYLFGGERVARVPVDPFVYRCPLPLHGDNDGTVCQWERVEVDGDAPGPAARIAQAQ